MLLHTDEMLFWWRKKAEGFPSNYSAYSFPHLHSHGVKGCLSSPKHTVRRHQHPCSLHRRTARTCRRDESEDDLHESGGAAPNENPVNTTFFLLPGTSFHFPPIFFQHLSFSPPNFRVSSGIIRLLPHTPTLIP